MASSPANLRAIYRSLLRELPPRPILSSPRTPLHRRIRSSFAQLAQQLIAYLRAQRMYVTLIERYNPGMEMDQDERIRLTARRVGMDLPSVQKKKTQ
ncbi:hypothetical protein T069G_06901 [Trichoderma breve]|uniref:Complex 1 LYR protein n=1 Tax=Trichoderma breve TaxID=2034170 RepID=A0A9W9E583_9HYPO|nr:hypothetical protein T069G_06901 [Trichoderma breve]KAJ4858634.1 hypothetical protein T069G_06901 [Trichoderma breve]